jgi:predicted RNA-binding Zn ribbon-like protein
VTHAPHATHTFDLSGGRLCLDFANTVGGMRGVKPKERLAGYAGLVEFAVQAGAVDEPLARRLAAEARRRPREAEKALEEALALREALYRIFVARANGREPARDDVELLSGALSRALSHRTIGRRAEGFALSWEDGAALDAPLWPIVASAAELLTSGEELDRVRVCGLYESQECSWLFVDNTRARTRRWCSMKDCGNVAKARRHHARAKGAGDAG